MLSRVADSLYWLGRYGERTETNAHIIDLQLDQMLERNMHHPSSVLEWEIIINLCGYLDDFKAKYDMNDLPATIYYVLFDPTNYNGVSPMIANLRENARNTRDLIPNDLWIEWNELYLSLLETDFSKPFSVLETTELLNDVRKTSLTATGVIDSLMTRDECFMFIKIGKWIERSEKTALIVHHLLEEHEGLSREFRANYALQLTNANEEFTRRFRTRNADEILNFLMGNLKCSRSVAYGIHKIKKTVMEIEDGKVNPYACRMLEALDELEQLVQINASSLSVVERREWVEQIRINCTNFGPLFAQTYYLTAPILVK